MSETRSCNPAHAGSLISYRWSRALSDSTRPLVNRATFLSGPTVVPFCCNGMHHSEKERNRNDALKCCKSRALAHSGCREPLQAVAPVDSMGCKGSRVQISALRPVKKL